MAGAGGVTTTQWRRCGGCWWRAWCFGIPPLRPCFGNCGATRRRSSAAGSARCHAAQGRAAGGNGRGVALATWGRIRRSGGEKKPYSANSSCRAITDTSTSLWISFTAIGLSITPGQTVTSPFLIQSLATARQSCMEQPRNPPDFQWENGPFKPLVRLARASGRSAALGAAGSRVPCASAQRIRCENSWGNAVGWSDGRWEGRGTHCRVDKTCKAESRLLFDLESPEFTYAVFHGIA